MRLWSIHPKYLDHRGLVALWRESLLAKKVLEGKTKGYKNHPQLTRFKIQREPLKFINTFLRDIAQEAVKRNYRFDISKIDNKLFTEKKITITKGQIMHEIEHLKSKLKKRHEKKYSEFKDIKIPEPAALFIVIDGPVEEWEKSYDKKAGDLI